MVIDMECRLRKALDRRKQKPSPVPLLGQGSRCVTCQREVLYRGWNALGKDFPVVPAKDLNMPLTPLGKSASTPVLQVTISSTKPAASPRKLNFELPGLGKPSKLGAAYSPLWR